MNAPNVATNLINMEYALGASMLAEIQNIVNQTSYIQKRDKEQAMSIMEIHWAALEEYEAYKRRFFDSVNKGYREKEIKKMRENNIDDNSIFICHLLGVYKASKEAGLTK